MDPEKWPEAKRIDQNVIVSGLLSDGFADDPLPITEEQNL